MVRPIAFRPRGVLNLRPGEQLLTLSRLQPSSDLGYFVSHYWTVTWDLRGRPPHDSEVLSQPMIHLTVEPARAEVTGIVRGKFVRRVEGEGWVFGAAFHPGGFYPFVGFPLSRLVDRTAPLDVLGLDARALQAEMLACPDHPARALVLEQHLRARLPAQDDAVALVKRIVAEVASDPEITRVDELVARFGLGKRALQRLFHQYVGIGPKWVIQRARLQEAAARLQSGEAPSLAALAASLGYFDQAHFIKEFKAVIGKAPADYVRSLQRR